MKLEVINILKTEDRIMVSSREVATKFGKRHDNVLRDIRDLKSQVTENFYLLNFEEIYDKDTYGRDQISFNITKDGFCMLAFGFTGRDAIRWKESFLDAFTQMEKAITEELPALRSEVESLRRNNFELTQQLMMLPAPKKPHGNKNTVVIPVAVNTLFGTEIEYRRVPKDSNSFSDITYKEGELRRLSNLLSGMVKKIHRLGEDISRLRRI